MMKKLIAGILIFLILCMPNVICYANNASGETTRVEAGKYF